MNTLHDPRDMLLFAKVIEHGSMSGAARATFKPKASISRAIARLEAALDVLLIERSSRGLVLTPEGRMFLPYCQRLVDDMVDAQAAVGAWHGIVRGRLRMAASAIFGRVWLGPILPRFLNQHSGMTIELELTNRLVDPVEEGFDLIIRTNPITHPSLVVRRLAVASYGLYASPAYLDAHAPINAPADLASHAAIDSFSGADRGVWEFTDETKIAKVEVKSRLDINDALLRRDAAVSGLGLVMIPTWIGNASVLERELVRVLPVWRPTRQAPVNALWPAGRRTQPRLHVFLRFLSDAARNHEDHPFQHIKP